MNFINLLKVVNIFSVARVGIMLSGFVLIGCGDVGQAKEEARPVISDQLIKGVDSEVLIVYYSQTGKTRQVAHWIAQKSGGDMVELHIVKPYPTHHDELVTQARREIDDGVIVELKTKINEFEKYKTIYLGTPIWWGTMATPVASFLSSYNFEGKTIIPFVTHGGGGISNCENQMKKKAPKARFGEALSIRDNRVSGSQKEIDIWVQKKMDTKK